MKEIKGKVLVWDWTIRVFHWLFALTLIGAMSIAFIVDHDLKFFRAHMLFGLCAGFLLLVRFVLGLVGSRPIRIGAAWQGLLVLPSYVAGLLKPAGKPEAGHNPLAWLVYLLMFVTVLVLILTGVFMSNHTIEEIHEIVAWVMLGLVGAHLIGIAIHGLRFRENISSSMLSGNKRAPVEQALPGSRPLLGVVVLLVSLLFMVQLFLNYEWGAASVRLPWLGVSVNLGEEEQYNEIYLQGGENYQMMKSHEHDHGEGHDHNDHD